VAKPQTYDVAATQARLKAELPHWTFAEGAIQRTYKTASWKATLMVVTTIGHLAEAAWHHPDLAVSYDSVTVTLSTHSAKGITDLDFALAAKIEDVVTWHPGPPFSGTPSDPRHAYIKYDE
jgi:4a-hydroxytetrahydrobiopterin dehydratase